jgi:2-oxoglutarate dehydrogenase E1 component
VASTPRELAEGRFQPLIDDPRAASRKAKVTRVVLCSGKLYVDLDGSEKRTSSDHVAVCRMEQVYPFPAEAIRDTLASYTSLRELVWAQEEPANMGAWEFVRPLLEAITGGKIPLHYVGRSRNASPSEGSAAWHQLNQKSIIEAALAAKPQPPASPLVHTQRVSGRAR